jgi:hypothetical protein
MNIDPKIAVWISIAIMVEQAIGLGALNLTDMIPVVWIPAVKSWCMFLAFIGTAILSALHYNATTDVSKLNNALSLSAPERRMAFDGISDMAKISSVDAMAGIKAIIPVTGATGAVAAAVADPNLAKVIDASPAPPSSPDKPRNA